MSSLTGQQAVNQALTLLAVLQPGEAPNATESADALIVINNIIDSWAMQRLQNLNAVQQSVDLTAATQNYVLSPRPSAIEAATFVHSSGITFPCKVVNAVEWGGVVDRNANANVVKAVFYDRDPNTPQIWVTPIPVGSGDQLVYIAWTASTPNFSSLTASVTLQTGYQRALIAASALELSPQYAVPAGVLTQVQQAYQESMSAIRQLNAELLGPEPGAEPAGANTPAPPTSPSGSPGA